MGQNEKMEHFGDCSAHDSKADDCRKMAGKVVVLVISSLPSCNYNSLAACNCDFKQNQHRCHIRRMHKNILNGLIVHLCG